MNQPGNFSKYYYYESTVTFYTPSMEEQSYPQAINLIRLVEFSKWKQTTDLIQATHLAKHTHTHAHINHTHSAPVTHLRTQKDILMEAAV